MQRIHSLDIFRGLTMVLMVLVNNPGDWGNVYAPLLHAEWHGCTPTDLVFPFFVFAMGAAIPFSSQEGLNSEGFQKILSRSLRLICLGLFLNFFSKIQFGQTEGVTLMLFRLMISGFVGYLLLGNFKYKIKLYIALILFLGMVTLAYSGLPHFSNVRLPGVLQRLGVVYLFTALIYVSANFRIQTYLVVILLVGYWLAMTYIPVPGVGEANYEKATNLAAYVDELLLKGHVWAVAKTWDPEGVLSTLPAIASCLIGVWAGKLLKIKAENSAFIYVGVALVVVGLIWSQYFPLNKSLWSSSFALFASGLGFIILVLFRMLFDNKPLNPFSSFLIMWGVNPIIVFFGAGILPRALNMISVNDTPVLQAFYTSMLVPLFSNPMNSSLVYALLNVCFWSVILLYLKKNNLIIKV